MKLHLSTGSGNFFTGHGAGYVRLGLREYRENLIVTPEQIIPRWAGGGFDALSEADFVAIAALRPEVALLGTGSTIRFPSARLTRPLIEAGIGLEIMDTTAACRTFNILAAEGRKVAVAILLDNPKMTGSRADGPSDSSGSEQQ
ncbi:MAG: hypothetical protein E6H67_03575 [Betaproteobacteria bacterium]|nr:MAG: hypothetical protein E6H74_11775 [Betaproteobacteria bacterium]TMH07522.1 MAG: hypothetical protein E6H67_03575 [Betaproteobacteria bacterium]